MPVSVWSAVAIVAGAAAGVVWRLESIVDALPAVATWIAAVALAGLIALAARWGRGIVAAACVGGLVAGAALGTRAAREALAPDLVALAGEDPVQLEGVLRDDAVPAEFGVACTLGVRQARVAGGWVPVAGGVRLTIGGVDAAARRGEWRAGRKVRAWATLRRPLPYRNFGTPDQEIRLAWRGIRLFGTVKSAARVEVTARGAWLDEATAAARAWTRRTVAASMGPDHAEAAAIVLAVLIGDRAGLAPDLEARMRRAGTYHVLAISGGNIAVVAALVFAVVARLGLSPRLRAMGVLAGLALYASAVVGGASVARATLAAAVYLSARAVDLRTPAINAVAVTVALLVATAPLSVVDVAFWLTTLASLAILVQADTFARALTAPIDGRLSGWPTSIARHASLLAGATIAAEGAVGPVTAFVFGQATVAGLALNFAAVPLMSIVQCAGFAILAAAAIHPALASVPAVVARLAAGGIVASAGLVDAVPWLAWTLAPPPLWLVVMAMAAWGAAWHPPWPRRIRRAAIVTWLAAACAIALGRAPAMLPPIAESWQRDRPCTLAELPRDRPWLRLVSLDVGQGDATLLRFPDGSTWLVDAGGTIGGSRFDPGARIVTPALRAQGIDCFDALVLTHGDADHAGGAAGLIPLVPPARVWEGVPVPGLAALDAARLAATEAGAVWGTLAAGTRVRVGGVDVRVLNPSPPDGTRRRPRNDDSVVLEITLGAVSIVLPGDAGPAVEAALADALSPARLRVLKAAHHGSRTSSTPVFLDAVAPAVVLVSAGRANRHGHPAPAVVARVLAHGAALYRTDRDGAIAIDTDGEVLQVTTCAGAHARLMPGRPFSTTIDARVSTEAPGRETKGTTR